MSERLGGIPELQVRTGYQKEGEIAVGARLARIQGHVLSEAFQRPREAFTDRASKVFSGDQTKKTQKEETAALFHATREALDPTDVAGS